MSNERVLVVDDEPAIRRFLRVALASQEYAVFDATTGQEALSQVAGQKPDVLILDLGLPDIDGVEVTRRLRERSRIPIIILSVRDSENDKIAALDAGADDYLTKPFGVGELLARLRAALRRVQTNGGPMFTVGSLKVDLERRLVTVSEQEVQLTPNEYQLLRVFIAEPGKVLIHRHLLNEVWGNAYENDLHMLHVNISNLRRKIELDPSRPQFIITEPGVGYRMRTDRGFEKE